MYNYNIESKNIRFLGKFLNNFKFRNDRKCDLHPKYSRNHKYLMFDTSHNGYRQIFFVKNLKMKNSILITGGAGFIGFSLSKELLKKIQSLFN